MAGKIRHVQYGGLDPGRPPNSKIIGHRSQTLWVPAGQEEMRPFSREFLGGLARDCRRRADNEHSLWRRVTPP